jgi:N-acetylglucosaminyldiphosphoundecaprenol N-acetyl-beta-D-mannosaminyltransferase
MDRVPYWLLGLPFDCVSETDAAAMILHAIDVRAQLTFATPNVNFVTMASNDSAFQQTILQSDLSLVDGMPLVWLGRACGIPFPERVAGSSLFERLQTASSGRRIRVFFFGGEEGVADAACNRLLGERGTFEPVGGLFPGFESLDSMSSEETITRINAARPDFLVVALGAKKGHAWIARNRSRIEAPVVSHLGAVVNFVAGRLRRSPRVFQRMGLEWLWRTASEPKLASRYIADFVRLARDLPGSVAHTMIARHSGRRRRGPELSVHVIRSTSLTTLVLKNAFTSNDIDPYLSALSVLQSSTTERLQVDVSQLHDIDCHALGAIYATKWRLPGRCVELSGTHDAPAYRAFRAHRAHSLINWRTFI